MFGKFLISFDVESLFTNVPLEECIDLAAVKYISEENPDLKLTPSDLKCHFSFATDETHFLFKGSFYDQIDGVAMGSRPAPVLASLFMGHHEKIWLEQYQGPEVLFYRHYGDDMFCLGHVHLERFSSKPMLNYWNNSFKYGLLYRFVDLFLTIVFFILSVMHYGRLRKIRETELAWEGDKTRA